MATVSVPRLSPAARRNIEGYLFISPWLVGILAFTLIPFVFSFVLGFTEWKISEPPEFIGLQNYQRLFKDELFWKSLRVTTTFVVISVLLRVSIALFLASLIHRCHTSRRFFLAGFYLPVMFSGVVLAIVWGAMFSFDYGLINDLLRRIGIMGPRWLSNPTTALIAIITMSAWRIGGMTVIFLAGIEDIPTELHEAAEIDGANAFQRWLYVTIPMLTPIVLFNLVTSLIASFQVFAEVRVLTGGGPYNSTMVYMIYLYRQAFQYFNMGYGSALAWVMFLIVVLLTLGVLRSSKSWVYYGGVRI